MQCPGLFTIAIMQIKLLLGDRYLFYFNKLLLFSSQREKEISTIAQFQITVSICFGSEWFWLVTALLIVWFRSLLLCPIHKKLRIWWKKSFGFFPTDNPRLSCIMYCYSYRQITCKNLQVSEFSLLLNPKRAGLFGPISQPGGGADSAPKISETDWRNIKCMVLVDSYDPPKSIGTKTSTNIPCMTPQWRHKWRHIKNSKITKNRQNHGFSLFFQAKLHFMAMMCVKVCLHMFLLQINQINKIKHSESVSWKQKKNTICV